MKVKFFPRHFYLFSELLREINKAFSIKTRPSEGSRAISLLHRRKLKMYRQNFFCFDMSRRLIYTISKQCKDEDEEP